MKELVRKLVEAWGPTGFEHHIRAIIRAEVENLADDIRVDALGNLICRMGSGGKRVMIAAHMDEIGLIISHVDQKGFLRFSQLGVLFAYNLPHRRVQFENGTMGVISMEGGADRHRIPVLDKFYIDVGGADSIGLGDAANFVQTLVEQGDYWVAKSMDNRISCAIAIEAMRQLKGKSPHELIFVFTVQEENGLRGATTAAFGVNPDLGIALDVTATGDTYSDRKMAVELGKGTAIKVMDTRHLVPPHIKNWLVEKASAHNIPYQLEILAGGSTDGAAIQLAQAGVPTGTISIPCRYIHSPNETVHQNDVQASLDLLVAALTGDLPTHVN